MLMYALGIAMHTSTPALAHTHPGRANTYQGDYYDPTRNPPFQHQHSGSGTRRPPPTRGRDPVARQGDRRRSIARRAVGDDSETRALLGHGLRLAHVRGETERPAEFHDRDRWARHSFHPRSLEI